MAHKVQSGFIVVGRISGVYGVRGWVKVFAYTRHREDILAYSPWYLRIAGEWKPLDVEDGRIHGKGIVAKLAGYEDRDAAARLLNTEIAVTRAQLPALAEGEYYWADLIGLDVVTANGVALGRVDHLLETGANDVLVVEGERERLIPFVPGQVVLDIDLGAGVILVDWDPEF